MANLGKYTADLRRIENVAERRRLRVRRREETLEFHLTNSTDEECMSIKGLNLENSMDNSLTSVKLSNGENDIGFYSISTRENNNMVEGELMYMYLIPEYRKIGLGGILLRTGFLDILRYSKAQRLRIQLEDERLGKYLESIGFKRNKYSSSGNFPFQYKIDLKPHDKPTLKRKFENKPPRINIKEYEK